MSIMIIVGVLGILAVKDGYFSTGSKKHQVLSGFAVSEVQHKKNEELLKQIQKKNPDAYLCADKNGPCIRIKNTTVRL